jgi:Trehalose-phosphatase
VTVLTEPGELPSALSDPALTDRLARSSPAVFLDYDGVLSPIVERPEDAVLDAATRRALVRLATAVPSPSSRAGTCTMSVRRHERRHAVSRGRQSSDPS